MTARRFISNVLKPGDHWWLIWALSLVPIGRYGGRAAVGVTTAAPFILGSLALFVVSALVPPPRPLGETSALAKRFGWLVRAGWAAVVFALAGVFGALIALDVDAVRASSTAILRTTSESIFTVVMAVLMFAGELAMLGLALDLIRAKEARRNAIWTLTAPLMRAPATRSRKALIDAWLDWFTTGWSPFLVALLFPVVAVGVWNAVVPFGNPGLALW